MRDGVPFVGASGKLLWKALGATGVSRGDCFVTNVVQTQPPLDKWACHSPHEKEEGLRELQGLLRLHGAGKVVLALGNEAFRACVGVDPDDHKTLPLITDARGYTWDGVGGAKVLAALHPAGIMRQWYPGWPCLLWDCQKLFRLLTASSSTRREELLLALPETGLLDAATMMAFDIETVGEGSSCHPVCISFALSAEIGYCVPFEPWKKQVAELLAGPLPKVTQNGQFDVTILKRHGITVHNWAYDTMLLWHAQEPMLAGKQEGKKGKRTQKSLAFLASLLTNEPYWKDYEFVSEVERWTLCAKDARITWECADVLRKRGKGAG